MTGMKRFVWLLPILSCKQIKKTKKTTPDQILAKKKKIALGKVKQAWETLFKPIAIGERGQNKV